MKFFVWFFGFFLLIAGIAIGIYYLRQEGPEMSQRLNQSMQAQWTDSNRTTPATDFGNQLVGSATAPQPVDHQQTIRNAALAAGVTLVSARPTQQGIEVTVEWGGSNATKGGDFLEQMIMTGRMRDFDDLGSSVSRNNRGQNVYRASYRLKM